MINLLYRKRRFHRIFESMAHRLRIRDAFMMLFAGRARKRLHRMRSGGSWPRIALVKQDCNEDLYCCPPEASTLEMLQSTLLRSGPVGLFTTFNTKFLIVKTEPDPECNIWREKWDPLRWCPPEWFEAFRDHVPGRDYGQSTYAKSVDEVDWNEFDIVISVDVSVPAHVSSNFPDVVWAYFVREIKAPSYGVSLEVPIIGQDLFLNHQFTPRRVDGKSHVVNFPYHFQYPGVFHEILGIAWPEIGARKGVFVEHHTAKTASLEELSALQTFGPVCADTSEDECLDAVSGEPIPARTMSPEGMRALMGSKYHVKWGGRSTFGTAKVEAIAAGCLVVCDRSRDGARFLQSSATSFDGFDEMMSKLNALEGDRSLFDRERRRQQRLVEYLCYLRPANDLLDAWRRTKSKKKIMRNPVP